MYQMLFHNLQQSHIDEKFQCLVQFLNSILFITKALVSRDHNHCVNHRAPI